MSRATPMQDSERILGQIDRGEARVGADAAREIAAKAEAEYGAAFRGTPAEVLRRQLLVADLLSGKDAA